MLCTPSESVMQWYRALIHGHLIYWNNGPCKAKQGPNSSMAHTQGLYQAFRPAPKEREKGELWGGR